MRLSEFIIKNMEEILVEWELFAETLFPSARTMDSLALRDHAKQILNAVAKDIETSQSDQEQSDKSKGLGSPLRGKETAATTHGLLRQMVGFDLTQLASEYRALRTSVIRLWKVQVADLDDSEFYEMMRFNEAIDQALAESIVSYSNGVDHSRQTFLAVLVHDLRSPLNSASMGASILSKSESLDAHELDVARRIKISVRTMTKMIDDLLEYAGGQLGRKIPIYPEAEDMEKICRIVLEEVRGAHPNVIFNFEKSGDLKGSFDPARFQQVLSNLLNNAANHGGHEMPVTLSAQGDSDETITIQVKNFGHPIPPDSLQVIFDPLVQVTLNALNSDSRRSTSLGLGLFIAKDIIEGHNGTIEVSSSEAAGTVFTVQIPRN